MLRVLSIAILVASVMAAQVPVRIRTPKVAPITSITIVGNKDLSADAIIAASGLKKNADGSAAVFDDARDRLLATGYFDAVSYSFTTKDLGFAVTFTVVEMKQAYPLRIEALPLTVEQANEVIKSYDPLFHGRLPASKPVLDRAALEIGAKIHQRVLAKIVPTGDDLVIRLAPAEGLPVIANVVFEGNSVIKQDDLRGSVLEAAIGQPFSDASVHDLMDRILRPVYEKQGYMRMSVTKITGVPSATVKGIDVNVTINEGPPYKPGEITIRGPMANDSKRLLRIAKLPAMTTFNGDAIRDAVPVLRDELIGEGYLDVTVTTDRAIHDDTKTVDAWFTIQPGEIYTFGRLTIFGLGLDGEAAVRKLWSVKPGDPFPGNYPKYFAQRVKEDGFFDNLGDVTAVPDIHPDTHTVDVHLNFAAAPAAQRRRPN